MGKKGKVGSVRKKINKKVQRKTCKKKQMKGGSNKKPNKSRKRRNSSVNKNKKKQKTSNTRTDGRTRKKKTTLPIDHLIMKQRQYCHKILNELRTTGKKTTHWAWWIFPTERSGVSEPLPKTCVSRRQIPMLLNRAPPEWQQVLELIGKLAKPPNRLGNVIPSEDYGRINAFCKLFQNHPKSPAWMIAICNTLKSALKREKQINGT